MSEPNFREMAEKIVSDMKTYRYQIHTHECDADAAINLISKQLRQVHEAANKKTRALFSTRNKAWEEFEKKIPELEARHGAKFGMGAMFAFGWDAAERRLLGKDEGVK